MGRPHRNAEEQTGGPAFGPRQDVAGSHAGLPQPGGDGGYADNEYHGSGGGETAAIKNPLNQPGRGVLQRRGLCIAIKEQKQNHEPEKTEGTGEAEEAGEVLGLQGISRTRSFRRSSMLFRTEIKSPKNRYLCYPWYLCFLRFMVLTLTGIT